MAIWYGKEKKGGWKSVKRKGALETFYHEVDVNTFTNMKGMEKRFRRILLIIGWRRGGGGDRKIGIPIYMVMACNLIRFSNDFIALMNHSRTINFVNDESNEHFCQKQPIHWRYESSQEIRPRFLVFVKHSRTANYVNDESHERFHHERLINFGYESYPVIWERLVDLVNHSRMTDSFQI